MTHDPVTVPADMPLPDAAAMMEFYRVSGLPVVDRHGALIGVISQTDLLHARATEQLWTVWVGLAVRHVMTSPAVTVNARRVRRRRPHALMEEHRIHRLVVVAADGETPIGVLSVSDLVRSMAAWSE